MLIKESSSTPGLSSLQTEDSDSSSDQQKKRPHCTDDIGEGMDERTMVPHHLTEVGF